MVVPLLLNLIEESLTPHTEKFRNIINFDNAIMTIRRKIKGEHNLIYNFKVWQEKQAFDILKSVGEYVTLVQLMDSLGNLNNSISIVGYCIFDSNYEKALCLTQESLDIICSHSVGEEQVATF